MHAIDAAQEADRLPPLPATFDVPFVVQLVQRLRATDRREEALTHLQHLLDADLVRQHRAPSMSNREVGNGLAVGVSENWLPTRSEYSQALVSVARFGSSRGVTTRTVERLEPSFPQDSRGKVRGPTCACTGRRPLLLLHSKFQAFGARSAPVKLRRWAHKENPGAEE